MDGVVGPVYFCSLVDLILFDSFYHPNDFHNYDCNILIERIDRERVLKEQEIDNMKSKLLDLKQFIIENQ
jgi:hypothetical protein